MQRLKRLRSSPIAWASTAATITQIFSFVQFVLIARILSPENYGQITAALAVCSLTSIFFELGLDVWLLKTGNLADNKGMQSSVALTIKVLFAVLWGLLIYWLVPSIRPAVFIRSILAPAIIAVALDGMVNVGYLNYFISGKVVYSSSMMVVARGSRLIGVVILLFLHSQNASSYLWSRVAIDLLVFAYIYIKSDIRIRFSVIGNLQNTTIKEILPYSLSDLINVAYNKIDLNILSIFSKSTLMIADFSIALNVVNAVYMVILSTQNVLLPRMTNAYKTDKTKTLNTTSLRSTLIILFVGLLTFVTIYLFGGDLINLMVGQKYLNAGEYLRAISPVIILKSVTLAISLLLISRDFQSRRLLPQAASLVFKVALGYFVLSKFGGHDFSKVLILSEIALIIGLLISFLRAQAMSFPQSRST